MPTIPIQPQVPPKINTGQNAFNAYLQRGYTFGKNDSGNFQNFHYKGVQADVFALVDTFIVEGWSYTVTPFLGGGMAELEAHAGWASSQPGYPSGSGAEVPENIWELDSQDTQKNLLEADFPNGPSLVLTAKESRDALAKILQNPNYVWVPPGTGAGTCTDIAGTGVTYYFDSATSQNTPGNPGYSATNYHLLASDYAACYSLYLLSKSGMEVFPIEASVISHTQLVSNQYAVQASFLNVGRIISSASMYSMEGVPNSLLYAVPTIPTPSQFIETAGDLQYGWRKVRPKVTRLAYFKWRIAQSYQFGLWATKAYGNVL